MDEEDDLKQELLEEDVDAAKTEDEEGDWIKELMKEEFGETEEEIPVVDGIEGEMEKGENKKTKEDDIDPNKING